MQKLAVAIRGSMIENTHFGSIRVCDSTGKVVAAVGDNIKTYLRSAAKPLQLLPLLESHAVKKFGFNDQELAIMAGSHFGTAEHAATIMSILNKLDLPMEVLKCGIHEPFSKPYAKELKLLGKEPTVLNNNCSGKHSAMLALCKLNNWDLNTYLDPDHPVQQLMLKTVSEMSGVNAKDISIGIDGCGVPVFGFELSAMARAFARLGNPQDLSDQRSISCHKAIELMRKYPLMIAGEGAIDTALLSLSGAKLYSKIGAEAVICVSIPEKGFGLAIKISDGNQRLVGPVVVEALNQLGLLSEQDLQDLTKFRKIIIKNFAKNVVGEIKPDFALQFC